VSYPDALLKELHRILKPEGILSFSDHHMKEPEIEAEMTGNGLFKLVRRERSYIFGKAN
jgi:ubiquinone/menaquinone biosynthesis C-methylase UbiE